MRVYLAIGFFVVFAVYNEAKEIALDVCDTPIPDDLYKAAIFPVNGTTPARGNQVIEWKYWILNDDKDKIVCFKATNDNSKDEACSVDSVATIEKSTIKITFKHGLRNNPFMCIVEVYAKDSTNSSGSGKSTTLSPGSSSPPDSSPTSNPGSVSPTSLKPSATTSGSTKESFQPNLVATSIILFVSFLTYFK